MNNMNMTMRNHTTLNANAEAYVPLNGGEKLIPHLQQARPTPTTTTTPTPKLKFLPYITKKPTTMREEKQNSTTSGNSPTNFARIVSPYKNPILKPKKPQHVPSSITKTELPTTTPLMLQLPLEIWHLITPNLSQPTIAALTHTHPSLHALLLPTLYHTIDLSQSSFLSTSPPDANKYRSRAPLTLLIKSQYLFIKQMLSHLELAVHVKELRWTLGVERHGLLPANIGGKGVVWSDEDLFIVFEKMRMVKRVDIGVMLRSHGFPSGIFLRNGLFPHAQNIKLGGIMKRKLVLAILHPKLYSSSSENHEMETRKGKEKETEVVTELRSLYLDDLQEESGLASTVSATQRALNINSADLPRLGSIQPMQNVLTSSLYPRCLNLQILYIKVYGMSERGTSDDELWGQWASFIGRVKPKEVVFDCERLLKREGRERVGTTGRIVRSRVAVANDRRFGETLLSVLREGWEGLERVVIKGVGESVVWDLMGLRDRAVDVWFES